VINWINQKDKNINNIESSPYSISTPKDNNGINDNEFDAFAVVQAQDAILDEENRILMILEFILYRENRNTSQTVLMKQQEDNEITKCVLVYYIFTYISLYIFLNSCIYVSIFLYKNFFYMCVLRVFYLFILI
jgi:hypothetical protein